MGDTDPLRAGAVHVVRTLREAGHEALFAGGCVRDHLRGEVPRDYDVATSATPAEVIELFERTVPVGVRFGVVLVLVGERPYEVATFRADLGYSDGRRPDGVRWSSAREDVVRRDFTINGLLADPLDEAEEGAPGAGLGRIIDYVGGIRDLERRVVAAIGDPDARFREDKLRILRAIRFAARLHFQIAPHTWDAVRRWAPRIDRVSAERVGQELERLLSEGGASRGIRLLEASGLVAHVLPEVQDAEEAARRLERLEHTSGAAGPARELDEDVAWTALLLDVQGMPGSGIELGRRLRLAGSRTRHVSRAVEIARALAGWDHLAISHQKRMAREPETRTAAQVLGRAEILEALDRWAGADLHPPALVTGRDLIAAGHAPGPAFQDALGAVEDAQLEGRLGAGDEEPALALALRVLEQLGAP